MESLNVPWWITCNKVSGVGRWQSFFNSHGLIGKSSCRLNCLLLEIFSTKKVDEGVTSYEVYS